MWSQVELVYSHIRDGNDAGADEAFGKLLTLFADQPTLPKEIYQVGDAYARAMDYNKAGALYQYVIANWPDSEYEMWAMTGIIKLDIWLGNDANVQPALDELIADFNDQPALPEAVFVISERYFYKQDYKKAIELWKYIYNAYPENHLNSEIPYLLATCYARIDDWRTAIQYYKDTLEKYPNSLYAHRAAHRIGLLYRFAGEYDNALYWLEQQRKIYPDSHLQARRALSERAALYYWNLKDYEKGAQAYKQYISEYPHHEWTLVAYHCLGKCYEKMGNTEQAIAVLEEALQKFPGRRRSDEIAEDIQRLRDGGER